MWRNPVLFGGSGKFDFVYFQGASTGPQSTPGTQGLGVWGLVEALLTLSHPHPSLMIDNMDTSPPYTSNDPSSSSNPNPSLISKLLDCVNGTKMRYSKPPTPTPQYTPGLEQTPLSEGEDEWEIGVHIVPDPPVLEYNTPPSHQGGGPSVVCNGVKTRRHYVYNTVVPFEEDDTHEFKGHRSMCKEELPRRLTHPKTTDSGEKSEKRSRQPVSRNLNGFLNTGKGGTAYLGIVDDGTVKGIRLSRYQKDHIELSILDLFSRYNPPVPRDRWQLKYVPVIQSDDINPPISESSQRGQYKQGSDERRFSLAHTLRTSHYCWCDTDSVALFSVGHIPGSYIIEIKISPYTIPTTTEGEGSVTPSDTEGEGSVTPSDQHALNYTSIYEDEEGNVYFRRLASLLNCSFQEVRHFTMKQVHGYYSDMKQRLKDEVTQLKTEIYSSM